MRLLLSIAFLFGTTEGFAPANCRSNIVGSAVAAVPSAFNARNKGSVRSGLALNLAADTPIAEAAGDSVSSDLALLEDALLTFRSDSAKKLLETLRGLRSGYGPTTDASVEYVNRLLEEGPDREQHFPLWATALPLSRFSKRSRLASLKRTLDMTTPPPDDDAGDDDAEDELRRRRRALVSLLQALASNDDKDAKTSKSQRPAIRVLEKRARQEQKSTVSSNNREDMLQRRPEGLETPSFEVVSSNDAAQKGYEIRAYDAFSVCSVEMSEARPDDAYKTDATVSDPKMAGARAFGALAGYLFGKNQQESAMAMTTPVLTSGTTPENKQMSFVLPSDYWKDGSLETAPQPLEGSGVSLSTLPATTRAVAMFGGYAAKARAEKQKRALLEALAKDPEWETLDDEVALAQYNDPFTPPWKRLNEVSVEVRAKKRESS